MANALQKLGTYKQVDRDLKNPLYRIEMPHHLKGRDLSGLGSTVGDDLVGPSGLGPVIENIRNRRSCSMLVMPNVEHAKWVFDGPQPDQSLKILLGGTRFDPFGAGPYPPIVGTTDTTLAVPSESQTNMIICAIGWHIRPEPLCFTALGNAYVAPTPAGAQPFSPDVFTINDQTNIPPGGSVPAVPSGMVPAIYEHGWWTNYVAWLMVAAYNLRWMMGQNTNIIWDELRNTAYMPPNAQDGSASDSEVDVNYFVNRLNQYYQSVSPGSATFLKTNAVRIGSVLTDAGAANVGAFTPSRDFERVGATYGGMGLREMLKGNSEFRPLATPYAMPAGVPFGLFAEVSNDDLQTAMMQYFSITNGFGGAPPATFGDNPTGFTAAATTPGFIERTLDGLNVLQTLPSQRSVFKGGRLIVEVKLKGFEISEDLYSAMKMNSRIREAICSECGIAWASR
jgi:hypothetical protein